MLEDDPDGAGDDALADAGDDAARHQHVLHGCTQFKKMVTFISMSFDNFTCLGDLNASI